MIVIVAHFLDLRPDSVPSWPATLLGFPTVALGCTLILLATLGSASRILRASPLRYLGKVSYGLYMYHALAIFLVSRILTLKPEMMWLQFPLSLSLTITIAAISYKVLEAPFLNLKRRFTYVESRPV
jgi:peptidoglycan/LPS O-acetylase OafA/YrhL